MDAYDLDIVKGNVLFRDSPRKALEIELERYNLDIKDIYTIELNGEQVTDSRYVTIYSEIVCDCLNNRPQ